MKYTVRTGDTLYKIALRYGITLDELIAANPDIVNPDVIQIGQVINIPVGQIPGDIPIPLPTPCPELPIEQPPFVPSPGGICPPTPGICPPTPGICPPMPDICPPMPYMGGMMPYMGGMMPDMVGMMPYMGGMMPYNECDEFFVIQQGDKGCHVRCVQERLKQMGYYNGACNGRFGSQTKRAVQMYQRDCGMEDTGIVDLEVLTALGLL